MDHVEIVSSKNDSSNNSSVSEVETSTPGPWQHSGDSDVCSGLDWDERDCEYTSPLVRWMVLLGPKDRLFR